MSERVFSPIGTMLERAIFDPPVEVHEGESFIEALQRERREMYVRLRVAEEAKQSIVLQLTDKHRVRKIGDLMIVDTIDSPLT